MKKIIFKYLDETYLMTLSSYVSFKLKDKNNNENISIKDVFLSLETIFSIEVDELQTIFDEWSEIKAIQLNNTIVELQEKLYLVTGKELALDVNDNNDFIDDTKGNDNIDKFIRNFLVE